MAEHKCLKQIDAELKKLNSRLVRNLLDLNQLIVATERIENLRDGKKAAILIASYCPFCGKRIQQ